MTETQIKTIISLTNFKNYSAKVFDNPINTLELIKLIASDYEVCIKLQEELYERSCFAINELMEEFENAETQIQLYKLILAELPKYL